MTRDQMCPAPHERDAGLIQLRRLRYWIRVTIKSQARGRRLVDRFCDLRRNPAGVVAHEVSGQSIRIDAFENSFLDETALCARARLRGRFDNFGG